MVSCLSWATGSFPPSLCIQAVAPPEKGVPDENLLSTSEVQYNVAPTNLS